MSIMPLIFTPLTEIRPEPEQPDVHHALPLHVEPLQEHPHDLRDLSHDEHHHREISGHKESPRVQIGKGQNLFCKKRGDFEFSLFGPI